MTTWKAKKLKTKTFFLLGYLLIVNLLLWGFLSYLIITTKMSGATALTINFDHWNEMTLELILFPVIFLTSLFGAISIFSKILSFKLVERD
jgi:hypothetical protein